MKKRVLVCMILLGVGFVLAFIVIHARPSAPAENSTAGREALVSRSSIPDSRASRDQRAAELKTRLSLAATVPPRQPLEKRTGWEGVPRDLNALLAEEIVDEAEGIRHLKEAEAFLEERRLDGTSTLGATCGKSLCRVSFKHDSTESFRTYQRYFHFSPWADASNYFSGEPNDDGSWKSYIWVGRDGFTLPLEELHQRNAPVY